MAFTVLVVVGVTGLVGLAPGLMATRSDVTSVLKSGLRGGGGTARRWSSPLVAAETALSGGVLVAAAVMVGSLGNLTSVDGGIDGAGLVAGRIALPSSPSLGQAYPDNASRASFWQTLSEELQRTPGVRRGSVAISVPVLRAPVSYVLDEATPPGAQELPRVRTSMVDPAFFDLFAQSATEGRLIESRDDSASEPIAVVNESFARRHYGEESALGQRIRLGTADSGDAWMTIVGVVPDFWLNGERNREPEGVYTPVSQSASDDPVARHGRLGLRYGWVIVDVSGGVRAGEDAIRSALGRIDAGLAVDGLQTVDEIVATQLRRYRLFGAFYLVFGAVALFLAVMGTYSVAAFSVSSRTPELGARMALGAQSARIRGLVLRQGFQSVAVGLVVGFGLALWLTAGLGSVVYEVDTRMPLAFLGGLGILAVAALVACLLPAMRATRIDPTAAIRSE